MKGLITVLVMVISLGAQASFLQMTCSSADGRTIVKLGHAERSIQVSQYIKGSYTLVHLDDKFVDVDRKKISDVRQESFSSCEQNPGESSGYASFDSYWAADLTIKNSDGSEFSKDTIGVSTDGKQVKAVVLCHRHVNSAVVCPN